MAEGFKDYMKVERKSLLRVTRENILDLAEEFGLDGPVPWSSLDAYDIAPIRVQARAVKAWLRRCGVNCHDCACHINPPCGRCENCNHAYVTDCPNDCQECEVDHEA